MGAVIQLDYVRRRHQVRAQDLPYVRRYVHGISDEDRRAGRRAAATRFPSWDCCCASRVRAIPGFREYGCYRLLEVVTVNGEEVTREPKRYAGKWLTLAELLVELWGGWKDALRTVDFDNEEEGR